MIKKGDVFVFESDEEIKDMIHTLKRMRNSKISIETGSVSGLKLHNGKPSIPDYDAGFTKCKLLRDANSTKQESHE